VSLTWLQCGPAATIHGLIVTPAGISHNADTLEIQKQTMRSGSRCSGRQALTLSWRSEASKEHAIARLDLHPGRVQCLAHASAHRFLHERADLCLVGGGQFRQREGRRPHGAFV
jgi:hypothetical protein